MSTSNLSSPIMQAIELPVKAIELRGHIKNFDIIKGKESCEKLYEAAVKIIQNELGTNEKFSNNVFLPTAIVLFEVLALDTIQFEDDLKLSLSKICNLFITFSFHKTVKVKRTIYLETLERIISICNKVLKTLPCKNDLQAQVQTHFALICCREITKQSIEFGMRRYGNKVVKIAAKAAEMNPIGVAVQGGELVNDLYRETPKSWIRVVQLIHLLGIEARTLNNIEELYQIYHSHKDNTKVTLSFIEALSQAIRNSPHQEYIVPLIESADKDRPGLNYFAGAAEKGSSIKINWKIKRYALQVLEQLENILEIKFQELSELCSCLLTERLKDSEEKNKEELQAERKACQEAEAKHKQLKSGKKRKHLESVGGKEKPEDLATPINLLGLEWEIEAHKAKIQELEAQDEILRYLKSKLKKEEIKTQDETLPTIEPKLKQKKVKIYD
ncbi:hypothetical protein NEOC84_000443|uniref:hypothetical protein n=1 Tax=Neochlamydia sp. AcF84 TaxID=2315858 RepID=UPI00140828A8|nr:hypothetical protein [Neochlamydia sp. AcF84]NGY94561.1 hypothetical protein [Neochlamydia sp. AcF84]